MSVSTIISEEMYLLLLKYTITLKMADQVWSDLHVVFTTILCGANFCVGKTWSSYSQVSFKLFFRACFSILKAVWLQMANLLTFVLIQVRNGLW